MKKLTIAISDEAHAELLRIQLEKKIEKSDRTTLAEVTSDVLHEFLVTKKADRS